MDFVGEFHIELILRFGGLPVVIPRVEGIEKLLHEYGRMAGLLIAEGEDLSPTRYLEASSPDQSLLQPPDLSKDEIEFRLMAHALKNGIPYLGLCRGCHILNVSCGGDLYADVQTEKNSRLEHINQDHYDSYRHDLSIESSTPLAGWYGKQFMKVNSYHHQGIRKLASCFRPMAHSPDGLVEAFYDPGQVFRVGLQFHPERMLPDEPRGAKIYEAFVQAAGEFQANQV